MLMQAYRWVADSRDHFKKERLQALDDEFKVRCTSLSPALLPLHIFSLAPVPLVCVCVCVVVPE